MTARQIVTLPTSSLIILLAHPNALLEFVYGKEPPYDPRTEPPPPPPPRDVEREAEVLLNLLAEIDRRIPVPA